MLAAGIFIRDEGKEVDRTMGIITYTILVQVITLVLCPVISFKMIQVGS